MRHYVYTLKCKDGTYYTGYTNDVERRVAAHQNGKGAKYTRGRGPVKLVRVQAYPTKKEAMQAEYQFKKLTRQQKEVLIREDRGEYLGGDPYVDTTKLS
ncbi:MAG TPA: GIY-YIG nuclease family protein [Bacillales bacterium]|nr:GIY-YIG nuclease family protein [Bacillales bacterium]